VEPIIDVTSYLNNLSIDRQMLIAKQSLSKTYFGQKRLIEPVVEDGRLKFKASYFNPKLSGIPGISAQQVFSTVDEAATYVSGFGITELANINFADELSPSTFRGYEQVLAEMNSALKTNNRYKGKTLSAQIAIHKARQGSKSIGDFLKSMTDNGTGFVFPTDEGGMALNFILGDKVLSTSEAIEVLQDTGRGLFEEEELLRAISQGDKGLSKLFAKLPKRLKGVLSPRDVSLSGSLIDSFLGFNFLDPTGAANSVSRMTALANATLNVDNVFEIMAYAFEENDTRLLSSVGKQADVMSYIRTNRSQADALSVIKSPLSELIDVENSKLAAEGKALLDIDDVQNRLKTFINEIANSGQIDAATGEYGIDIAKKKLKESKSFSSSEKGIIGNLFDEIEKGYDGSSLINRKNINNLKAQLRKEKSSLATKFDEDSITRRIEIDRQLTQLNEQMSQMTVRGSVRIGNRDVNYKSAAQVVDFLDRFDKYGIITSVAGLKRDTSIAAGTAILNFSGAAESTSRVYSDPMLTAFHQSIFGEPEELAMIEKYRKGVLDEFEALLARGRINEDHNVMKAIRKISSQDIDALPEEQQFSKMLNRDWAKRVLELHQSGVSIRDSNEYLNLLKVYYDSELFVSRKGMKLPVLPEVYRYAINSEANAMTGVKGNMNILSGTAEAFDIGGTNVEMAKFRISNHNILFHENDIRRFYHALGGFDLDDKGLPILGTFESGGKRRFAAAMARQPTAAGELIGLTRFSDLETYQELFGNNKLFMRQLDEMLVASSDSDLSTLKTALTGKDFIDDMFDMNNIEQTAIRVWDQLYQNKGRKFDAAFLQRLGRTASENLSATQLIARGAEDPMLMSLGFQRLKAEVETMQVADELFNKLSPHLSATQIQSMKDLAKAGDSEALYKAVSSIDYKILNQVVSEDFLKRSVQTAIENENILGVYVNRSTVIGQGLYEFEQMFKGNKLPANIEEILKQKNIMLGLLPAETAIDMTQTFTSGRLILKHTSELAASDPSIAKTALERIYGQQALNLGQFGETTMRQYGKLFGFLSQYQGFDAKIDEVLLSSGKLSKSDLTIIAEGISQGMVEGGANAEDIKQFNDAVAGGHEEVEKLLRSRGFIGVGKLSEMEAAANISERYSSALFKLYSTRSASQEQLLAADITRESRIAAENILDRNSQIISSIKEIMDQQGDANLEEMAKYRMENLKFQLGDRLLADMEDVSRTMGISGYELISSLEYVSSQRKYPLGLLEKLPDTTLIGDGVERAHTLHRYLDMAQKRRNYQRATSNVALKDFIESLTFSPEQRAGILNTSMDFDFVDGFFSSNGEQYGRADVIKSLLLDKEAAEATAQEVQISSAIRARVVYEQAQINDSKAAAFVNGSNASGNVLRSADQIADDTPDVVADTLRALSDERSPTKKARFQRITKEYLSEQLAKPTVRNIAIGTGLAVAASFIYQGSKDRTAEDISGPPLLPGGSAYESDYPRKLSEIAAMSGKSYNPGMNYKVSLYGNRDQVESFRQAASGLTNGNINSTMYNRIPDVASNPYQEIAGSF
jgi:hypothetical protein